MIVKLALFLFVFSTFATFIISTPSVSISTTTDYVFEHEPFNLTCSVENLINDSHSYRIVYEFSYVRVEPWFSAVAWYEVLKHGTPTFHLNHPSEFDIYSHSDVIGPDFPVTINATSDKAAGVYRCKVFYLSELDEIYLSDVWRAKYYFVSDDPEIPTVEVSQRTLEESTGITVNCSVKIDQTVNFDVGFLVENTETGEYSVDQNSAKITWKTVNLIKTANIFPTKMTTLEVFSVILKTTQSLDYISNHVQCYVRFNVKDTSGGKAIYYAVNSGTMALIPSILLFVSIQIVKTFATK